MKKNKKGERKMLELNKIIKGLLEVMKYLTKY